MKTSASECDVAVGGGGPAGAAHGTFLSRAGHCCVVLEEAHYPRCLIGDVVGKDMPSFTAALEQMIPPPGPLEG